MNNLKNLEQFKLLNSIDITGGEGQTDGYDDGWDNGGDGSGGSRPMG